MSNNILIKHVRDDFRTPVATIVATNEDMIGVAICSPKDHFNRKRGISIAYNRAFIKSPPAFEEDFPNREIVKDGQFKPLSEIVLAEIERMKIRAQKYYWQ